MVLIVRTEETMNVGQIAEKIYSSRHHVAKILQRLAKSGFITSSRGPSGGFSLKKDPSEITLLDIYETIEGKLDVQSCPGEKELCPFDRKCLLGDLSHKVSSEVRKYMAEKKLSDFI